MLSTAAQLSFCKLVAFWLRDLSPALFLWWVELADIYPIRGSFILIANNPPFQEVANRCDSKPTQDFFGRNINNFKAMLDNLSYHNQWLSLPSMDDCCNVCVCLIENPQEGEAVVSHSNVM